jgi:hypothetical protein
MKEGIVPMKFSITEIFTKAEKAASKDEKIKILRENDSIPLRVVVQYTFDKRVRWLLPEGTPPYKPTNSLDQEGRLYNEARKLYLFIDGGNDSLSQTRREMLFIQVLESIDPEDAKLLLCVKDKYLPFPTLTPTLFAEAYPDLPLEFDAPVELISTDVVIEDEPTKPQRTKTSKTNVKVKTQKSVGTRGTGKSKPGKTKKAGGKAKPKAPKKRTKK